MIDPAPSRPLTLGARPCGDGRWTFRVWAPKAADLELHLVAPAERRIAMTRDPLGYHACTIEGLAAGARYFYTIDGKDDRPDPASRRQPEGVHGPSEVVDPDFAWRDAGWRGIPLEDAVFYEIHVGTFTPEGTFDAAIPHLDGLRDLGVTAVEIMPVAQFPGSRNWGYDGVYPFAVQDSYGGPAGLRRLVQACHERGLAAVLDVVYNHLGPEGNYLWAYAPYFTDRYKTPWGWAVNFDGPDCDEVRRYFLENALSWVREFHFDGLRLDAIHAIVDASARTFLAELGAEVRAEARRLGRRVHVIAESDLNDARVVTPEDQGGWGLDAMWSDDLHHSLHVLLTGERNGYYEDFDGPEDLIRAYRDGFVYRGQRSRFRRRRHGNSAAHLPSHCFVVCATNHDQIGNRRLGDRLAPRIGPDRLRLAAGAMILSPFLPLLFMGEEYGETAPFPYFVSHGDAALIEAVRAGRKAEFPSIGADGEPPDPASERTFTSARLDRTLLRQEPHQRMLEYHRHLLRLRRTLPALTRADRTDLTGGAADGHRTIWIRREGDGDEIFLIMHFDDRSVEVQVPLPSGTWRTALDSADASWGGPGGTVPPTLRSNGGVSLSFAGPAVALLVRIPDPRG